MKKLHPKTIWILEKLIPIIDEAVNAAIIEGRKSGLDEGEKIGEVKAKSALNNLK